MCWLAACLQPSCWGCEGARTPTSQKGLGYALVQEPAFQPAYQWRDSIRAGLVHPSHILVRGLCSLVVAHLHGFAIPACMCTSSCQTSNRARSHAVVPHAGVSAKRLIESGGGLGTGALGAVASMAPFHLSSRLLRPRSQHCTSYPIPQSQLWRCVMHTAVGCLSPCL